MEIPDLDHTAMATAREWQARLIKPAGALGRLEELSVWLAGVQGRCPPRPFAQVRAVVVAGDHGVARAGVSAYPPEVTAQMVAGFAAGGAAVNVLARQACATVRVVDVAVDGWTPDQRYKVRFSSGRIDREDALSADETSHAFTVGRAVADEEVDAGADLLVPGDMGIGNTTPSAALVAALLDMEPVAVVGRGTGIDDRRWMVKTAVIRDALWRGRRVSGDPRLLLGVLGGADLAALSGLLLQAATRRTPVVLDGVTVCAAALATARLAPGTQRWWVASHRSPEPAQQAALAALGLEPLLDLGMRLGEGTGGLLAVGLLQAARATLAEMATFDEAGVTGKA